MKQTSKIFAVFLVIFILFGSGFWWGRKFAPQDLHIFGVCNQEGKKDVDFGIFWDAWRIIENKYRHADDLNHQEMVYGAVGGLVKSLGDPYSEFLKPEISKQFFDDIKGSFEGIGAEIGIKNNILTIIAPLEGTPAKKAGLQSGDKIIKINDILTADLTLEEAISMIRGPRGTKVKLIILRGDDVKPIEIEILRGVIKIPVIKWEPLNKGEVAYIQLYSFTESATLEFNKVAQQVLTSSAKKIILDLRDNPGGYLDTAVDIAGWFVASGEIVAFESRGQRSDKEYRASGNAVFKDWPVLVLINEGSASASEILAGALRDQQGAKLLGQKSFGKGSVQEMEALSGGASMKLTVADWLTPKRILLNNNGLKPDIEVLPTEEDIKEGKDLQLEKALEYFIKK